jgi:hypothetical protein
MQNASSATRIFILAMCFLSFVSTAEAGCLSVGRNSTFSSWVNYCARKVWVNWNDNRDWSGWSCSDFVGALQNESADIGDSVQWCEWYDGQQGHGPC